MDKVCEKALCAQITVLCRDLYLRELVSASGGNVSVRVGDSVIITSSGSSLGRLTSQDLVKTDLRGNWRGTRKPSKELGMHLAVYSSRADVKAIVHAHSPCAVALSCLRRSGANDVLPVFTPGYVMRVGRLPMVPYAMPGSPELMRLVRKGLGGGGAVLLQNHGVVAVGSTLDEAVNRTEEVEEGAKIFFLTQGRGRAIAPRQIQELRRKFGAAGGKR